MPSLPPTTRLAVIVVALLLAAGLLAYPLRWQYISQPGAKIVRINRWTNTAEFLTDSGWTSVAVSHDPFRNVGDRHP